MQQRLVSYTQKGHIYYTPHSKSELELLRMISKSRTLALKQMYRKVNRKQVYSTLNRLEMLGKNVGGALFYKKTVLCPLSNQPILLFEFCFSVKILGENSLIEIKIC